MARCLRCGADSAWIEGKVLPEPINSDVLIAANDLADAAEKLGKCSSKDSERPEHFKHCARCAVKQALKNYREATR